MPKMQRAGTADRNAELARIHIAKKQLGMDDDAYRDMLWAVARKRSAADLDFAGRNAVLDHLKSRGFKDRPVVKRSSDPLIRKVRALWLSLADAGKVDDRSEKALSAFVKRQTGVEQLQWCDVRQKSVVIEALKAWRDRA